jgi:hypothetical protein
MKNTVLRALEVSFGVVSDTVRRPFRRTRWICAWAASSLAFASFDAASAAVLVSYPFNNNGDGSSGFAHSSLDATVLASSTVSKGVGLGQYSVATDNFPDGRQVLKTGPGTSVSGATAANALANDWYFQLTLTPSSSMDIDSIEADWSRGGTTGVRGWFIRSSLDNYASDLFAVESPDGTAKGFQHVDIPLTGFTDLATATNFRFYVYTSTNGRYLDFSNVQFNGPTVAPIPEPTSLLSTGGLLGLGLLVRRRAGHSR